MKLSPLDRWLTTDPRDKEQEQYEYEEQEKEKIKEEQVSALKELDETMSSLWHQAEISDQAKLFWNDLVAKLKEEESK
jgi:hypothetical protein